ncbi:MAG: YceI family protein [Burkholderiales bacterium]
MRNLFIAVLVVFGCGRVAVAADSYTLDSSHTFPRFEINHFGFSTHHGQFNKTSGKLVLDRTAKTGSLDITVQTASIGTGDPKLEEHLRGTDFFNVEKFPTMTFKAKTIKFEGNVPASAEGELTLLGVTKPLTLTISRVVCAQHSFYKKEDCGAEVSGKLKRSDFGMTKYVPAVGDEVTLHIQVESLKD